ncbi:MAG: molybdate ABC transporter substrate-binding protein [Methyloligellaceae bacterium]
MSALANRLIVLAFAAALTAASGLRPAAAETVTVFAAASLTNALEEIAARYRKAENGNIRFSFAASSTLARQIEAGAPAQILGSANERWMDHLAKAGLIVTETRVSPISNRLVLIAPAESTLDEVEIDRSLDLAALLGEDARLAVGDPAHVPAGLYARQALEHLGLWRKLEPRLALADNVRAALALVARGEAPLGIVYETDARITDRIKVLGVFPKGSHKPITYPFATLKGAATREVRALFDFITGAPGRAVFRAHGFSSD